MMTITIIITTIRMTTTTITIAIAITIHSVLKRLILPFVHLCSVHKHLTRPVRVYACTHVRVYACTRVRVYIVKMSLK